MKTHYSLLDAVRFFAAFWVMNFHYIAGLQTSQSITWYRYGNLGVQLFFIISGFVIIHSLRAKTLGKFASGRFLRLFPLFWVLCTATYILTLLVPHTSHVGFWQYVVNMSMLPDIYNGYVGHGALVDASYWTLTVELLFYTGIGLSSAFFSYKNIRYVLLLWLTLSVGAFIFYVDQNFYVKLLLVRHASYFIFGSALALITVQEIKNIYQKCVDWFLLCASALYSLWIQPRALLIYAHPNAFDGIITRILLLCFFLIIPLLVYTSRYIHYPRLIRVLGILGGITYPLYLLHQKIGNTLINYFTNQYNIPWNTFAIPFEILVIFTAYILYIQDNKLRTQIRNFLEK